MMKLLSRTFGSFVVTSAILACGSDGTGSSSGPSTVTPSCYQRTDGTRCECQATKDDANRIASDERKVSSCNSATAGTSLSCTVDTSVDGKTSTCACEKISCYELGDQCYCGAAAGQTDSRTSCTGYEWCCAKLDGSDCHCGNGAFGSGCANGEQNVSSCTQSSVELPSANRSSCDGLTWAPPPAPAGGTGGGGCSSSSECIGKCPTRCYDCRSNSCVCGRIGSSGSCMY